MQLTCHTGEFPYTPAREIAFLRTRFSGKRLETDHPEKISAAKMYCF